MSNLVTEKAAKGMSPNRHKYMKVTNVYITRKYTYLSRAK
jgi:hypothetical protein